MPAHVEVVPSALLPARAAIWIADRVWRAVACRGLAHLALSGGTTPDPMIRELAKLPLPWDDLHVWQVDERVAPDGDPARNAQQLHVLGRATLHLMDVTLPDLETAASGYAAALPARLDVVHLGLGEDGHTASWPPESSESDWTRAVAVVGPYRGHVRLTLTPPVVALARDVMFLVAGSGKRQILRRLLDGAQVPAQWALAGPAVVLADPAAAG
jgi:6-phosphogluconolactonase/glucosamine-6-phosphate isomerase/deaminase